MKMEKLLDLKQALQLLTEEKGSVLCVVSDEEEKILRKYSAMSGKRTSYLSCQHLEYMEEKISGSLPIRLCVTTQGTQDVSIDEMGLIYAMLVRCRKVISCRDKLEDMLRHQDEIHWEAAKQKYEDRVMALFKKTWTQVDSYPYIIVDNIKAYNKGEGYIMKALYQQLSERTPGMKNDGDAAMIVLLQKMFEEISLSLIKPDVIILGKHTLEIPQNDAKIFRLDIL
ncbi:MAG: hypothetical protein Q4D21_04990 [Phascolarctobacterium sp.]|nr:hypothetical protein [Phascolarctobacterium sp.]